MFWIMSVFDWNKTFDLFMVSFVTDGLFVFHYIKVSVLSINVDM